VAAWISAFVIMVPATESPDLRTALTSRTPQSREVLPNNVNEIVSTRHARSIEDAGEAEDGRQAGRLTAELNPAVVIMDMPYCFLTESMPAHKFPKQTQGSE